MVATCNKICRSDIQLKITLYTYIKTYTARKSGLYYAYSPQILFGTISMIRGPLFHSACGGSCSFCEASNYYVSTALLLNFYNHIYIIYFKITTNASERMLLETHHHVYTYLAADQQHYIPVTSHPLHTHTRQKFCSIEYIPAMTSSRM